MAKRENSKTAVAWEVAIVPYSRTATPGPNLFSNPQVAICGRTAAGLGMLLATGEIAKMRRFLRELDLPTFVDNAKLPARIKKRNSFIYKGYCTWWS